MRDRLHLQLPLPAPPRRAHLACLTSCLPPPHAEVNGGVRDMRVLKTTQSGYEGFLHDRFTTLPDVRDRVVATSITSPWR